MQVEQNSTTSLRQCFDKFAREMPSLYISWISPITRQLDPARVRHTANQLGCPSSNMTSICSCLSQKLLGKKRKRDYTDDRD